MTTQPLKLIDCGGHEECRERAFFANGQDRGKCFKRRGRLSKLIKKEQQREVFVNSGGAVEMPGISRGEYSQLITQLAKMATQ